MTLQGSMTPDLVFLQERLMGYLRVTGSEDDVGPEVDVQLCLTFR